MKSTPFNLMPALACVEYQGLTTQGLISPMSPLAWQLPPLCDEPIGEPERSAHSGSVLEHWISEQLLVVRHLHRTRRQMARAYIQVRRCHTHTKAQRALRRQLRRLCSASMMEVQL